MSFAPLPGILLPDARAAWTWKEVVEMESTRVGWIVSIAAVWMVSLAATVATAEDMAPVARVLAERLRPAASAPHAPRYFNAFGTAVRCVALTAKEIRSGGRHVFACATQDGEVL